MIPQLKAGDIKGGRDEDEVISLTNEIIQFVTEETKDFATYLGGKQFADAPSYRRGKGLLLRLTEGKEENPSMYTYPMMKPLIRKSLISPQP